MRGSGDLSADLLDFVCDLAAHASGMPPELAQALERVPVLNRAPCTVAGLCMLAGLPEHRLRYAWTKHRAPGRSPKELVDWMILAWAVRSKATPGLLGTGGQRVEDQGRNPEDSMRKEDGKDPGRTGGPEQPGFEAEGDGLVGGRPEPFPALPLLDPPLFHGPRPGLSRNPGVCFSESGVVAKDGGLNDGLGGFSVTRGTLLDGPWGNPSGLRDMGSRV